MRAVFREQKLQLAAPPCEGLAVQKVPEVQNFALHTGDGGVHRVRGGAVQKDNPFLRDAHGV